MSILVHVPSSLRTECNGASELRLKADSVRAALEELQRCHPALYQSVCDETGAVRRHVNLFLHDRMLNKVQGLNMPLAAGDELSIMPAVSGG